MDSKNRDEQRNCNMESDRRSSSSPDRNSAEQNHSAAQQSNCSKFLKSLSAKQPQDIILVLGTGVSAAVAPNICALQSWRSCLMAILDTAEQLALLHPKDISEFRRKVENDSNLFVVTHNLIRKMSPNSSNTKPTYFLDCLLEVFDKLECRITCPEVLNVILNLMEKGAMVITTNYDVFLETVGHHQNKDMQSLDMKDTSKLLQWTKGQIPYGVLHIHGLYSDPRGILLDPTSYKNEMQHSESMVILQNLFSRKTFLFLGCGEVLREHVFQALFWPNIQKHCDLSHYMLVLNNNDDNYFKLQDEMLLRGIKVISYGNSVSRFPQYLKNLSSVICRERSPGPCQAEGAKRKTSECECEPPKKFRQTDDETSGTGGKKKVFKGCTSPPKKFNQCDDDEPGGSCQL